jgi:predicted nuclease of restriction endonuclease-like (RecB) superfamily
VSGELINSYNEIVELIEQAKNRVNAYVNRELIDLYLGIGEYVSEKVGADGWGRQTVKTLAEFLSKNYPDVKGFSAQNIWRMKQFYDTYKDDQKLSTLSRELSWSNNCIIFSRAKTSEEREFYLKIAKKERYSVRELERQIDSSLFERVAISDTKKVLGLIPSGESLNFIRDNYMLEFLSLPEGFKEKDLRKQIVSNLKKFILEFGKDFVFVGEEYRIQVGNEDFYIDLVFFHRELSCLVVFELKIDKFKPEYIGKMDFYLEALDRDVKKIKENPSIGVILCANKDDDVVEYALSRNISPTLVAEYKTKLIDKNILRRKLHEFYELADHSQMIYLEEQGEVDK